MGWLLDPLAAYGFMRAGLVAALAVGVTSAVLSCLLVVRHQALLGDAISHVVLLGVALGYLAAGPAAVPVGALLVAVGAALLITYLEQTSNVSRDAIMGVVFTTAFAAGLALISVARPRGVDLFHVLFGNLLGVAGRQLVEVLVSALVVLAAVAVLFHPLRWWAFDPEAARRLGVPTRSLEYVFAVLLAATVVAALQAVGIVLVIAMLVIPGAAARLVAGRLATMMVVAAVLGALSAVGGLYSSFYSDVASGPAIVLWAAGLFAVAYAVHRVRGRG